MCDVWCGWVIAYKPISPENICLDNNNVWVECVTEGLIAREVMYMGDVWLSWLLHAKQSIQFIY